MNLAINEKHFNVPRFYVQRSKTKWHRNCDRPGFFHAQPKNNHFEGDCPIIPLKYLYNFYGNLTYTPYIVMSEFVFKNSIFSKHVKPYIIDFDWNFSSAHCTRNANIEQISFFLNALQQKFNPLIEFQRYNVPNPMTIFPRNSFR